MNFLKKGLAQVSAAVEKAREATTMGGTSGEGAMAGSRSSGALPYAPGAPAVDEKFICQQWGWTGPIIRERLDAGYRAHGRCDDTVL